MPTYNVTGDATFVIFDRVLNDFADDDVSTITFANDIAVVKTGKNGNTIYSKNEMGRNATATLRLIRGSSDDVFLQGKIANMRKDFATTELAFGSFRMRLGDGQGNVLTDVYSLSGGIVTRQVDAKENVSGDTVQAVSIYNISFADAERSIQ